MLLSKVLGNSEEKPFKLLLVFEFSFPGDLTNFLNFTQWKKLNETTVFQRHIFSRRHDFIRKLSTFLKFLPSVSSMLLLKIRPLSFLCSFFGKKIHYRISSSKFQLFQFMRTFPAWKSVQNVF